MFCSNCGAENQDGAVFCRQCGKKMGGGGSQSGAAGTGQQPAEPAKEAHPSKKAGKIVAAVAAVALIAGAALFGYKMYQDKVEEEKLQEELAQKESEEQERQQTRQEYVEGLQAWLEGAQQDYSNYVFDSAQTEEYNQYLSDLKAGMENGGEAEELEQLKGKLETLAQTVAAGNLAQIEERKANLDAGDTSMALPSELEAIEGYRTEVDDLAAQGSYSQALEKLGEWEALLAATQAPLDTYQVSIRQYDISEYPAVKVYLDVTDQNGNFVDNLSSGAFFVNESRTIDGEFERQQLVNATKLDENEGISISLVADVSGSMRADMSQAQRAMYNFVNTMQFDKGDEVELTEFSEYAYVCKSFTNNVDEVVQSINGLSADGSTRLYDTLISEIERIQSRGNAKCIIGFTDGFDNVSVYTAQDVVNSAVASNIPVFLIGIGSSCDSQTLQYIAESTGGFYENISDISSLETIYNSIYTQQKEVYMLEYQIAEAEDFERTCYTNIYIRNENGEGGYVEGFSFEPSDFFDLMYNKFLIAGIDCQTKGERNLLDSGLIVTSGDAYSNGECIAYQSQASIDSGGVGSRDSSIFEVLVYYDVLNVHKDGDGYILYGLSNYNISRLNKYSSIKNSLEKEKIASLYGEVTNPDQQFWIEENISNYEKLTLIKDTDGRWKFYTRVYEREDGGSAISTNAVYNVQRQ